MTKRRLLIATHDRYGAKEIEIVAQIGLMVQGRLVEAVNAYRTELLGSWSQLLSISCVWQTTEAGVVRGRIGQNYTPKDRPTAVSRTADVTALRTG